MSTQCVCPPGVLPSLTNPDCEVKLDLLVRMIIGQTSGDPFTDITTEAGIDLRLNAVDNTKAQFTPLFADTDIPGTEIILTAQNDNTSPFGEGFRTGETSTTFTATFANLDPAIKDELKAFECFFDLGVAFYDAKGRVVSLGNNLIPIDNFFIGTRQFGGRTEKDLYTVNFTLPLEWDQGLTVQTPTDYDGLTKQNP